jgi:hypothetical protein
MEITTASSSPPSTPQHQHAQQREDGQGEAVAPQPPDPPQGGQVEEPEDGADHDRGQGGLREVAEQRQQRHRGQHGQRRHQQRHQLGVGAGAVVGGRLAGPAAGDEALEQAGEDVGDADGPQLAVGLDVVTVLVGHGLGHGGALGVADDGDRDRPRQQPHQLVPAHPGDGRQRDGPVDRPDDLDPTGGQVGRGHQRDPAHDHQQGRGHAGGDPLEAEQHGQAAQPDRGRPEVHVAEPARHVAGLGEEVALAGRHPEQLGQLADDDGQPQAEHEADLDPGGDEARHEPHPEQAEGDQDDPDQHGQEGREVGVAGGVAQGDRGHDRRRDGRRGRGRADDQLPAGAEQAVAEQPGEGGEQPGLGRQPGDLGVGDRLRHHQRPGGEGGDDVPPQPGTPVVPQPADRRHRPPR